MPGSMVVEALSWRSRRHESCPFATPRPAFVGRKQTVVRDQLFPQKSTSSRLWLSRIGIQHSPGSLTIALPSALAESGAYPTSRALPDSPRQRSLPFACRHSPKGIKLEVGRGEHLGIPSSTNLTAAASAESRRQPVGCISRR